MRFGNPVMLNLLWLLPVIVVLFYRTEKKRQKKKQRFGSRALVDKIADSESLAKRKVLRYLQFFMLLFLVCALARPQIGTHMKEVKQKGVDVVVVVDTSVSMLADDLKPTRLERAVREVSDFIDSLRGHRIGLVAFAGSAFVVSPLTMDYSALKIYLDILDAHLIPYQGTAIGNALTKAAGLFDPKAVKNKAVVLITDGEDHEGKLLDVCKKLKKEGITMFVIGIGTTKGVPINIVDETGKKVGIKKDRSGGVVMSKLNPDLLAKAAALTGGKYFTASTRGLELDKIRKEIDTMGGRELKEKFLIHYEDRFQIFLFFALLLWLVIFVLGDRKGMEMVTVLKRKIPFLIVMLCLFVAMQDYSYAFLNAPDKESREAGDRYEKGDYETALKQYDSMIEKNPEAYENIINRGNVHYKMNNYDDALADYERCSGAPKEKLVAASYFNKGNALFRTGQYKEALEEYKNALKINPSDYDAKHNLEVTLQVIKQQQQQQCDREQKEDKQQKQQDQDQQKQDRDQQQEQKEQEQKQQQKDQQQEQKEQEEQQKQDREQQQKEQEKDREQQQQQKEQEQQQEQKAQEQKEKEQQQEQKEKEQQDQQQKPEEQQGKAARSGAQEDQEKQMEQQEALKLLDAIKDDEKDMQRQIMQRRIEMPEERNVEKDW